MTLTQKTIALVVALATVPLAQAAGFDDPNLEARSRAKILKQKAKQNGTEAQNFNFNNQNGNGQNPDAQCGSQNIGNVNTGGRVGAAPREVFIFAPDAINVVSGRACQ